MPGDSVIHVVDGGWHTELVLSAGQAPVPVPAGTREVAVGFGARGWYMARVPGSWDAVQAVLGGPGVVLARPLPAPPRALFGPERVAVLRVSPEGMAGLRDLLARTLAPGPVRLADGPYPGSAFYAARARYGPTYTCNTWVVDALRAAGLSGDAWGVVTAGQVMREARRAEAAQATAPGTLGAVAAVDPAARGAIQPATHRTAPPAAPRRSRLYTSTSTSTGTWSLVRGQSRASVSTSHRRRPGARSGVTQMWSRRRPRSEARQSRLR